MFHVFFIVKALHIKIKDLLEEDAIRHAQKINALERLSNASEEELLNLDLDSL
jgi:hypothetical protein